MPFSQTDTFRRGKQVFWHRGFWGFLCRGLTPDAPGCLTFSWMPSVYKSIIHYMDIKCLSSLQWMPLLKKTIFCLALLGTTTLNSCWEYCSTALNLFYKWEEGGQAITLGHFCTLLRKHHSTVKCTWSQLCRKHYSFSLPWRWSESSPLATCICSVWNWNRVGQSIRYQIAVELYLKDFEVRKELIISK